MDLPMPLLKALADKTRYGIVQFLLTHNLCVRALSRRLGVSDAAISQHLQILRRAGLVKGEKRGYWTHYSVERDKLREIAGMLGDMADQGVSPECMCQRMLPVSKDFKERRAGNVCKECCERPDQLKKEPRECTLQQIQECHGDKKDHPCEKKDD
jgi:ArsR family transcriptional regulator, arsenate/arsenite/antimonite-responsive transcriptional repressor